MDPFPARRTFRVDLLPGPRTGRRWAVIPPAVTQMSAPLHGWVPDLATPSFEGVAHVGLPNSTWSAVLSYIVPCRFSGDLLLVANLSIPGGWSWLVGPYGAELAVRVTVEPPPFTVLSFLTTSAVVRPAIVLWVAAAWLVLAQGVGRKARATTREAAPRSGASGRTESLLVLPLDEDGEEPPTATESG